MHDACSGARLTHSTVDEVTCFDDEFTFARCCRHTPEHGEALAPVRVVSSAAPPAPPRMMAGDVRLASIGRRIRGSASRERNKSI